MENGLVASSMARSHQESIFDRAWAYMTLKPHGNDIENLLEGIEIQLALTPGFLTKDSIIKRKVQTLSPELTQACTKDHFLNILLLVLSEIKVVDLEQKTVYGNFADNNLVYQDNENKLLYKSAIEDGHVTLLESPYLEDPLSTTRDYESDVDEASSLMENGYCFENASSVWSLEDGTFNLQHVLEELNFHHLSIHLNFRLIEAKLNKLEGQNHHDIDILRKLTTNNESLRDRMHDMKREIHDLFLSLEELKSCGQDDNLHQIQNISNDTLLMRYGLNVHTNGTEETEAGTEEMSGYKTEKGVGKDGMSSKERTIGSTFENGEMGIKKDQTGTTVNPLVYLVIFLAIAIIFTHKQLQNSSYYQ